MADVPREVPVDLAVRRLRRSVTLAAKDVELGGRDSSRIGNEPGIRGLRVQAARSVAGLAVDTGLSGLNRGM